MLGTFIPLILMLAIFYFGLIRPQKKKEKEVKNMRDNLLVGDEIVTIGGVVGKIVQVKKDRVIIETTGMKTRLEFEKWGIQTLSKSKGSKNTNPELEEEKEEEIAE
ncbi:preprotein translocase subunit YajC [Peptoniphilus sp. KCTC 25270]|nr:preprotein translocase subunit YajC [Peptoniphilus sp. KCTC 25270]MCD1147042.1 preprotein translocase subunit YajC [Peptoniphilus sp. KCTC 25270]